MGDFAIFGSGPLLAHQLRDHISDVDVIARGKAWTTARLLAHEEVHDPPFGSEPIARFWGLLEISCGWISPDWDIDELIDTAEDIDGLPFVRLEYVLRYKLLLNREKDQADIAALQRHLGSHVDGSSH